MKRKAARPAGRAVVSSLMKWLWIAVATALLSSSCVSKKEHQLVLDQMAALEKAQAMNLQDCNDQNQALSGVLEDLQFQRTALELRVSALNDSILICENKLEENNAYIQNLGSSLDQQRRNLASELEAKNKTLQAKELELNDALAKAEAERMRLEKLRKELETVSNRVKELEAELRRKEEAVARLKEAITAALAGFSDLGIAVEFRNGKVYVILPEKLLFKSGSIDVDPKGQEAILQIAQALKTQTDVRVAVEGHTDNIPMKSATIKDNLDLSVLRATSIARIMISGGMDPAHIAAVGRGDTQPVADNTTPEGRAKNRRTEIVLTPQLDKILEILNEN